MKCSYNLLLEFFIRFSNQLRFLIVIHVLHFAFDAFCRRRVVFNDGGEFVVVCLVLRLLTANSLAPSSSSVSNKQSILFNAIDLTQESIFSVTRKKFTTYSWSTRLTVRLVWLNVRLTRVVELFNFLMSKVSEYFLSFNQNVIFIF